VKIEHKAAEAPGANREPPHSTEAEQSVLGGLLLENRMHPVASELLTAASFFRYEHGQIYSAILELVSQGQPADVITVFEVLDRRGVAKDVGGLPYLNALAQSVPSAANIRRYCEIVNERKVLRELMAVTDEAWNAAMNPNGRSAAEVVLELLSRIAALGRSVTEQGPARGIDAADLLCKDLPSPTYILKPFLAEGLTLLAASPKAGKTTLMRQVAEAVNCGSEVLGETCAKGDVLFLSLEEGEVLFREKLKLMKIPEANLRGIRLEFEWPQAARGVDRLRDWLKSRSGERSAALIIIDSLARFRLTPSTKANIFMEDYNALKILADLCKQFPGVSICVLHHTTKANHDDPLACISGSHGLTAAVDGYMVLTRKAGEFKLHAGGRLWTSENQDFTLRRSGQRWWLHGAFDEATSALPRKQRQILELLGEGAKSNTALCQLTGQDKSAMSHMLGAMERTGLIQRVADGWVALH
jgi:hypothetical protein